MPLPQLTERTVARECEHHGPYQARQLDMPEGFDPVLMGCPTCASAADKAATERRRHNEQRLRMQKLRGLTSAAAIPEKYSNVAVADFVTEHPGERVAKTICETYVRTWADQRVKGGSLVFTGVCGTGKTHLACGIGNAVMGEHLGTVMFGTVPQIVGLVRETYRDGAKRSERQVINDMMEPDLLIVDEIGAHRGTEHELQVLFEIINTRYQALKPMILISNLNKEQLESFLGERIMDRFRECGIVVPFNWPSYRARKQGALL